MLAILPILAEVAPASHLQMGIGIAVFCGLMTLLLKLSAMKKNLATDIINQILAQQQPNVQHIGNQPLDIRAVQELTPKGEFIRHKEEIWQVINGIRSDITKIREHMASIRALREENGNRLERVEEDVKDINRSVGELVQALHDHNKSPKGK